MSVYDIVTSEILKKLDAGVVPWHKPWDGGCPAMNWTSKKPYNGINTLLLSSGEYLTYKQAVEAGGNVKKGEHGHMVVFFKMMAKNADGKLVQADALDPTDNGDKLPVLRYYRVFEVAQCEGIERRNKIETRDIDAIAEAEKIVAGYKDAPKILYEEPRAFYSLTPDIINMPPRNTFHGAEEFYSTLFHEMTHSTGHLKRLARKCMTEKSARFGSKTYGREELVAEIGAAMLCGVAGISAETLDNSAAYIANWRNAIKGDNRLVITAAGQAQKAADYIRGIAAADKK